MSCLILLVYGGLSKYLQQMNTNDILQIVTVYNTSGVCQSHGSAPNEHINGQLFTYAILASETPHDPSCQSRSAPTSNKSGLSWNSWMWASQILARSWGTSNISLPAKAGHFDQATSEGCCMLHAVEASTHRIFEGRRHSILPTRGCGLLRSVLRRMNIQASAALLKTKMCKRLQSRVTQRLANRCDARWFFQSMIRGRVRSSWFRNTFLNLCLDIIALT